MPTRPNKRTIRLRQTDEYGRDFIQVETKETVQWASCGKLNGEGSVSGARTAYGQSMFSKHLQNLSENAAKGGLLLTVLSPLTFGATAILGVPLFGMGVIGMIHARQMQPVRYFIPKKPCDPHKGLF